MAQRPGIDIMYEIPTVNSADCKDGVYTTVAEGMNGNFDVTVTIKGGKITQVDVGKSTETAGLGSVAVEQIPGRIVAAQSADIDVYSTATVTSKAVIKTVKLALVQAAK